MPLIIVLTLVWSACGPSKDRLVEDEASQSSGREEVRASSQSVVFNRSDEGAATPPWHGEGGIASLEWGEIGGHRQWITIRGEDSRAPLLLWLHGGPGLTEIPFLAAQRELERHFVVVNWDQRGAGKSYGEKLSCEEMTIDGFVSDAGALARYLLARFRREHLFIVGHSWGAIVGMLLVQRYPDLCKAFIGMGQPVCTSMEDGLALDFVRDTAVYLRNEEAIQDLKGQSRPLTDRAQRAVLRRWVVDFGGMIWQKGEVLDWVFQPEAHSTVPEYTPRDWEKRRLGLGFSWKCLERELNELDLFVRIPKVGVPVFFFLGVHDHQVPFEASVRYFDVLEAPVKEIVWFHHSAHFPHLEEPARFAAMVLEKLLDRGEASR
ncbi:MAG TPA: alpha/beta hydrolase [Spirochaetia bacterium]|nr:alpha/beta hydrolase [Spirochaetia bacterium]